MPDFVECVCGAIKCIFENDISFAVCIEAGFANSVDRDWLSEFFVRLEIVFVSRHSVSTT